MGKAGKMAEAGTTLNRQHFPQYVGKVIAGKTNFIPFVSSSTHCTWIWGEKDPWRRITAQLQPGDAQENGTAPKGSRRAQKAWWSEDGRDEEWG